MALKEFMLFVESFLLFLFVISLLVTLTESFFCAITEKKVKAIFYFLPAFLISLVFILIRLNPYL